MKINVNDIVSRGIEHLPLDHISKIKKLENDLMFNAFNCNNYGDNYYKKIQEIKAELGIYGIYLTCFYFKQSDKYEIFVDKNSKPKIPLIQRSDQI
ncbi:MAG: hypothetical protein MJZ34_15485 [Paludibacteraceae bacterium]|nr:hypothetical protein [Paludibacteraceae bacterium]